jgi:pre-mRNA-processing factor 19
MRRMRLLALLHDLSESAMLLESKDPPITFSVERLTSCRRALANVQATMGVPTTTASGEDAEMNDEAQSEEGIPKSIMEQMEETRKTLTAMRKKRKVPSGYATASVVKTFTARHTIPSLHSSSPAGITSLSLSRLNPSQFLTGGNDKIVQLYDQSTDKVLASLKGHTKKINHVTFREREGDPTLVLSAGADKIAKIWSYDAPSEEYLPKSTIRTHKGELTGLAVHPMSTLAILASLDKTYSLHDLSNFTQVFRSVPSDEPFTCLSIHPDGTLIALGTATSTIQVYDARTGAIATTLVPPNGTSCTVNTSCFSENGYHFAAPDSLSSVAIWDLRKQKMVHSVSLGENFKVNKVLYDVTAQFLGIAGNEGARVFLHKTWEELTRCEEGGEVTDIAFGPEGKQIWGASGREIRIWGTPE